MIIRNNNSKRCPTTSRLVFGILVGLLTLICNTSFAVTVPGRANPWLAGMPDGTVAQYPAPCYLCDDTAPEESPVLVVPVVPRTSLIFSASGVTGIDPDPSFLIGPEGFSLFTKDSQFGISGVTMPYSALAGVFLTSERPDISSAPTGLDFTSALSRDYLSISPEVKQVFFIGDGLTSSGTQQVVVVPAGATRLFLGTMDSWQWHNNVGQLTVAATALSTPGSKSFAAFIPRAEMKFGPHSKDDSFKLTSYFKLATDSNGINPPHEVVVIQFGTFSANIPAGSFQQDGQGFKYVDQAKHYGVWIRPWSGHSAEASIQPNWIQHLSAYQITVRANALDLDGTTVPPTVQLIIGDDMGQSKLDIGKAKFGKGKDGEHWLSDDDEGRR